jgi:hypothetical protein
MATMTITIPDTLVPALLGAFSTVYPIPVDENGDPLYTEAAWARGHVRDYIRDVYRQAQAAAAAEAARLAAAAAADGDSDPITVT